MSTNTKQFEGATIEEAIEAAMEVFGADIEVIDAWKQREGGVLGFFEKERFVVTAGRKRPELAFGDVLSDAVAASTDHAELLGLATATDSDATMGTAGAAAPVRGQPDLFDRPEFRTREDAVGAADATGRRVIDLRDGVNHRPPVVVPVSLPVVQDVVAPVDPPLQEQRSQVRVESLAPTVAGSSPHWGVTELRNLGLPEALLLRLSRNEPENDLAWAAALEDTISELLSELPRNPSATAVGHGIRSAVELIAGATVGITPDYLDVDGHRVPATATELALAIRECLR